MGKVKQKGNGEGTLYLNQKTKLYVGQYVYNGKRKSVYQKKNEKTTDFKRRFNNILSSIDQGSYIEKSNESLLDIIKDHIEQKYNDGITSGRTYKRDLETLEELKKTCYDFINKPIQKVTIKDIETSKKEIRQYSNSVIDKMWRLLIKGFKIAHSRRKILFNIMDDENLVKPISLKETKKIEALSKKELKKLNTVLDNKERNHKYRNIVKLQLKTAMRIGEVLARSEDDIDLIHSKLTINNTLTQDESYNMILGKHTKTYSKKTGFDSGARTIPIDNETREIIIKQLNQKITNIYKLLFWDYEKNTFVSPNEINQWLRRINKKYKITNKALTSHVLRHTAITNWRDNGLDLRAIQYIAGHIEGSSITDDVYVTTSDDFIIKEFKKANKL